MKTKREMGQWNVAQGAAQWEAKTFMLYGGWKTTFKLKLLTTGFHRH